jgi:hypothetical protein
VAFDGRRWVPAYAGTTRVLRKSSLIYAILSNLANMTQ